MPRSGRSSDTAARSSQRPACVKPGSASGSVQGRSLLLIFAEGRQVPFSFAENLPKNDLEAGPEVLGTGL
jgi:hypothetical protein